MFIRALALVGCVLAACTRPPKAPAAAVAPLEGAVIRIAAAGDISNAELGMQRVTSDLVLDGGYDAVLTLGDNQYPRGELLNFERYYAPTWGRFKAITWPSVGNHEYGTKGAAGYFDYFGARAGKRDEGYYSFELGDWHLIALNSNCGDVGCGPGSPQLTWLTADLAATKKKCVLAYWHHPRFSSGPHGNAANTAPLWDALAAAHSDVVLSGHDHIYERFEPRDGIQSFVVGTGGSSHYPVALAGAGSATHDAETFGILELQLGAGAYAWRFLSVPGATFTDTGRGSCH